MTKHRYEQRTYRKQLRWCPLWLALIIIFVGTVQHAQNKAVIPPAPFKLSVDATKEYIALEQQKAVIVKAFNDLNEKERLLMIDIPEAARSNCKMEAEQIACTVPEKKSEK